MTRSIPPKHPLRRLFDGLTQKCFMEKIGLADFELSAYVSGLLIEFLHVDDMYRLRNARGRRIYGVGEMLLEAEQWRQVPGVSRECEIRKHIGDYTLFMAGLFPESIERKTVIDLDYFVDYIKAGKESYRIAAEYDRCGVRTPLLRKLSQQFEICTLGLNFVKEELEKLQNPAYRQMRDLLFE